MNRYTGLIAAMLAGTLAAMLQLGCGGSGTAALAGDVQLAQDPAAGLEQQESTPQDTGAVEEDSNADDAQESTEGQEAQGQAEADEPAADAGQAAGDVGGEDAGGLTLEDWYEQQFGYTPDDVQYPDPVVDDGGGDDGAAEVTWRGGASATDDGTYRYISADGLPDHGTGQFPGPGNPNAISAQSYSFRMPLEPVANSVATGYSLPDPFGIALNGVLFDPFANEFWNNDRSSGWQLEPMPDGLGLDSSHGHVQPTGAYHYHGLPWGMLAELDGSAMGLLGFAADGFPVYALYGYDDAWDSGSAVRELRSSYRLRAGMRDGGPGGLYDGTYIQDYEYVEGLGDLDECNGRFGVTEEFPQGTYYYVVTADYPYIPRQFRGMPDASFTKQRGPARAASHGHAH